MCQFIDVKVAAIIPVRCQESIYGDEHGGARVKAPYLE